jgi:hypothetical protein
MKSFLTLAFMLVSVSACSAVGAVTDGFKHSDDVATDLEATIGAKPFVGFNWNNGVLTDVNITFDGVPKGKSTEQIISTARNSIGRHFKQAPQQIVISFTIPGKVE